MPVISSILADVLHIIKIILICICFFRFNQRKFPYKVVKYVGISLSTMVVSLFIFYFLNPIFDLVIYVIFVVSAVIWLFDEKFFKLVTSTLWIMFVTALLDTMSNVLVQAVYKVNHWSIDMFGGTIVSLISLVFVVVVGCFFKVRSKIGLKDAKISRLLIFLAIAIVDSLVCSFIYNEIKVREDVVTMIALCAVVVGTFIQLGFIVALYVQNGMLDEQKKIVQRYLNEQKEYYEYLIEREADTRKFRHDVKNHMLIIKQMIEAGENEKFQEYLKRFANELEELDCKITIFNGTADAVINRYYAKAVELGIDMKVSGKFPVDCKIDAYDICAIFSNILSNAVEASKDADEKRISLECRYSDDNTIIICLCNTYKEINMDSNGKLLTRKKDKLNHGFGMEIVADSVKLYNGWYDVEIAGGEFRLRITLNL